MSEIDEHALSQINQAAQKWRQGDCVLGDRWFMHHISIQQPLTQDGAKAAAAGSDIVQSEVLGLMVLTQTCDIVRDVKHRPFIEVCPIVAVSEDQYHGVTRLRRPNLVAITTLAEQLLVGDLDRVMTVEKSLLAEWERIPGWHEHNDGRTIAFALARKRQRVAFPDEFNRWIRPLFKRVGDKHDRRSDEGAVLRNIREIRVRAAPSWTAKQVAITLYFILSDGLDEQEYRLCVEHVDSLVNRLERNEQYHDVSHHLVELDDMTARDYVESDLLDLEYLTISGKEIH